METNESAKDQTNFFQLLLSHPAVIEQIPKFIDELLELVLKKPELSESVCTTLIEKLGDKRVFQNTKQEISSSNKHDPKDLLNPEEAATLLGLNRKYFLRNTTKFGLTKIYLSSRSIRFKRAEIDALAEERGVGS